mmetsp:Transcript_1362/g.1806  ORF Transcript_1362/g.1806 Transcript_1362/m.1806 type:complete len:362 (-) Transcript_1362:44-1129(-)
MHVVLAIFVLALQSRLKPALAASRNVDSETYNMLDDSQRLDRPAEWRIIGGKTAPEGRYPYIVSLQHDLSSHYCGGSVVASDIVLTAAHCVAGINESTLTAITNPYNVSNTTDEKTSSIDRIIVNPLYSTRIKNGIEVHIHDVALLQLKSPLSNYTVLLNSNQTLPKPGTELEVLGWGYTNNAGSLPDKLQEATVESISLEECDTHPENENRLSSDMLCAASPGKDSCSGDSGGPLILKGANYSQDIQVGAVSWGSSTCASKFGAGVYNNIAEELDWIRFVTCLVSQAPPSYLECDADVTWSPQPTLSPTAPTCSPSPSQSSNTPSSALSFTIPSASHPQFTKCVWWLVMGIITLCSFMLS